jgi:hypothetical protein
MHASLVKNNLFNFEVRTMSFPSLVPSMRHASFLLMATTLAVGSASAQMATSSPDSSSAASSGESSSAPLLAFSTDPGLTGIGAPASGGSGGGAGQEHGGNPSRSLMSRLTFELGAGFNSPIGNDGPYITWGGNFTLGAGLRMSDRLSLLGEYQYIDNKLPGAFVAAGGGDNGNAHINSVTVDPVLEFFPKWKNGLYAVGGFGWYHKSTNFNVEECCDFFGYPVNVTANSFSSNQLGANFGLGIEHKLGGFYGDGKSKLFAEARYTFINTPGIDETNGLGRTELIPVTLGIRF